MPEVGVLASALGASELRLLILRHCARRGAVTTPEVVREFGVVPNAARRHLLALAEAGVIRRERVHPVARRWVDVWRIDMEAVRGLVDDLDLWLAC